MSDDGILRLQFPALHLAQQQVMDDPHRFKVVACGRRFGKTTLGISAAARTALLGGPVAWCGPTYRMVLGGSSFATSSTQPQPGGMRPNIGCT